LKFNKTSLLEVAHTLIASATAKVTLLPLFASRHIDSIFTLSVSSSDISTLKSRYQFSSQGKDSRIRITERPKERSLPHLWIDSGIRTRKVIVTTSHDKIDAILRWAENQEQNEKITTDDE
jgi:hypothetical protein